MPTGERANVLALIPARGGSKGLPNKNLREVAGISLVGRAVLMGRRFAAVHPELVVRVVVDSDDKAILNEARRWGGETPFLRPPWLAEDDTTTYESTAHILGRLAEDGFHPDKLLLLQPTSPLRTLSDVSLCWRKSDANSVVSVSASAKSPQFAMTRDAEGVLSWTSAPPPTNARRQELADVYFPNGSVYVVDIAFLLEQQAFVVEGRTHGVLTSRRTSLDVDDQMDLAIANVLANWEARRTPEVTALCTDLAQSLPLAQLPAAWSSAEWVGADDELQRWVAGRWSSAPDVVIIGTAGGADHEAVRAPSLDAWRALGVSRLALAIPDARVLERYQSQLRHADCVFAPAELVERVREDAERAPSVPTVGPQPD